MSPTKVWSYCNTCRGQTAHTELRRVCKVHDYIDWRGDAAEWAETYRMLQCQGCSDVQMRVEYWDQHRELDESDFRYFPPRIYRKIPDWAAQLPEDWRSLMREIYDAIATNSFRLAVMGARTLIDLYLTEAIANHGGFDARLDRLVKEGHLGKKARDTLEAALDAGSAAAHRGHKPDIDDLNAVLDITEHLLQSHVLKDAGAVLKASTPQRPPKPPKP